MWKCGSFHKKQFKFVNLVTSNTDDLQILTLLTVQKAMIASTGWTQIGDYKVGLQREKRIPLQWSFLDEFAKINAVRRAVVIFDQQRIAAHQQESVQARNPPWLWNPWQTSPEVQNRGISGPTKRTCVLQKFYLKFYFKKNLFKKKKEKKKNRNNRQEMMMFITKTPTPVAMANNITTSKPPIWLRFIT